MSLEEYDGRTFADDDGYSVLNECYPKDTEEYTRYRLDVEYKSGRDNVYYSGSLDGIFFEVAHVLPAARSLEVLVRDSGRYCRLCSVKPYIFEEEPEDYYLESLRMLREAGEVMPDPEDSPFFATPIAPMQKV